MAAPVELELHRLSKQRGAFAWRNETAIIGKGLQNALKWYMGMPSKVNIKKVTTLINAKNTGIFQPKRIGRCVTF